MSNCTSCLGYFGERDPNRFGSICVLLPRMAKVSRHCLCQGWVRINKAPYLMSNPSFRSEMRMGSSGRTKSWGRNQSMSSITFKQNVSTSIRLPTCQPACLPACLSGYRSICVPLCVVVHPCTPIVCQSICLPHPSKAPPIYLYSPFIWLLSACLPISLSICLLIHPSNCQCVCLFDCLSVGKLIRPFVCRFMSFLFHICLSIFPSVRLPICLIVF